MHFVIVAHEDGVAAVVVDEVDDVVEGAVEDGGAPSGRPA